MRRISTKMFLRLAKSGHTRRAATRCLLQFGVISLLAVFTAVGAGLAQDAKSTFRSLAQVQSYLGEACDSEICKELAEDLAELMVEEFADLLSATDVEVWLGEVQDKREAFEIKSNKITESLETLKERGANAGDLVELAAVADELLETKSEITDLDQLAQRVGLAQLGVASFGQALMDGFPPVPPTDGLHMFGLELDQFVAPEFEAFQNRVQGAARESRKTIDQILDGINEKAVGLKAEETFVGLPAAALDGLESPRALDEMNEIEDAFRRLSNGDPTAVVEAINGSARDHIENYLSIAALGESALSFPEQYSGDLIAEVVLHTISDNTEAFESFFLQIGDETDFNRQLRDMAATSQLVISTYNYFFRDDGYRNRFLETVSDPTTVESYYRLSNQLKILNDHTSVFIDARTASIETLEGLENAVMERQRIFVRDGQGVVGAVGTEEESILSILNMSAVELASTAYDAFVDTDLVKELSGRPRIEHRFSVPIDGMTATAASISSRVYLPADEQYAFTTSSGDYGFQASSFILRDGTLMIGYAGTDPTDVFGDLLVDAYLGANLVESRHRVTGWPPRPGVNRGNTPLNSVVDDSVKFFDEAIAKYDEYWQSQSEGQLEGKTKRVVVTGHSLGAFQAQMVAMIKDVRGITFASPGVPAGIAEEYGIRINRTLDLTNYRSTNDPIGMPPEFLRGYAVVGQTVDFDFKGASGPLAHHAMKPFALELNSGRPGEDATDQALERIRAEHAVRPNLPESMEIPVGDPKPPEKPAPVTDSAPANTAPPTEQGNDSEQTDGPEDGPSSEGQPWKMANWVPTGQRTETQRSDGSRIFHEYQYRNEERRIVDSYYDADGKWVGQNVRTDPVELGGTEEVLPEAPKDENGGQPSSAPENSQRENVVFMSEGNVGVVSTSVDEETCEERPQTPGCGNLACLIDNAGVFDGCEQPSEGGPTASLGDSGIRDDGVRYASFQTVVTDFLCEEQKGSSLECALFYCLNPVMNFDEGQCEGAPPEARVLRAPSDAYGVISTSVDEEQCERDPNTPGCFFLACESQASRNNGENGVPCSPPTFQVSLISGQPTGVLMTTVDNEQCEKDPTIAGCNLTPCFKEGPDSEDCDFELPVKAANVQTEEVPLLGVAPIQGVFELREFSEFDISDTDAMMERLGTPEFGEASESLSGMELDTSRIQNALLSFMLGNQPTDIVGADLDDLKTAEVWPDQMPGSYEGPEFSGRRSLTIIRSAQATAGVAFQTDTDNVRKATAVGDETYAEDGYFGERPVAGWSIDGSWLRSSISFEEMSEERVYSVAGGIWQDPNNASATPIEYVAVVGQAESNARFSLIRGGEELIADLTVRYGDEDSFFTDVVYLDWLGAFLAVGNTSGDPGDNEVWLWLFSVDPAAPIWMQRLVGLEPLRGLQSYLQDNIGFVARRLASGADHSVTIVGSVTYGEDVDNTDILVTKINQHGRIAWMRMCGGQSDDRGYSVSVGDAGEVLIGGFTDGKANGMDGLIMKLDGLGYVEWETAAGSSPVDEVSFYPFDSSTGIIAIDYGWNGYLVSEEPAGPEEKIGLPEFQIGDVGELVLEVEDDRLTCFDPLKILSIARDLGPEVMNTDPETLRVEALTDHRISQ